jgi:ABC-type multidrug transport system fused ATPase/permease subunit
MSAASGAAKTTAVAQAAGAGRSRTRMRNLRGLLALVGPYRRRALLTVLALLLGTAAMLTPPLLAKLAIDKGIERANMTVLVLSVLAFLAAALVSWMMTYIQTYLVGWIGQRALADLRIRIFDHLQSMPLRFYESRPAGVLISRITNDIEALDTLVTDSVVTLFSAGLTLIGTIAILLLLDLRLAVLTFIALVPMALGSIWFRIASTGAFRRTRETIGALTAYLQETLSGISVVRAFATERRHEARFGALNAENRSANMATVYLNAAYFPAVELLSGLAIAGIVLYGGNQAITGAISLGTIVAFIAALSNLFEPIQQLSQLYTTYQSGMAALEKIFSLLDERPQAQDRDGTRTLARVRGEVRFERVSFHYDSRAGEGRQDAPTYALREVDLEVPAGATVALVGATGAGKSTLVKLLCRFYNPTEGRVLVDGIDLRTVRAQSLRRRLGIVPQEAFLFSGTIAANIAFGKPDASPEQIRAAAAAVGAAELIEALPEGFDTPIGERGVQLSAGQRQLIAFARALIADPRILILDEATSSVDLHTEARLQRALAHLLAGRTAFVIAHRLSTIRDADQILVLEGGRIVQRGRHEQLIAAGGPYARMHADFAGAPA